MSKDDRANAVPLQQRGAPQDEGSHHELADVRAADDEQSSEVRQIERIGRAPLRSRADHGQGGMPGKVTYFSAELTRAAGGKYPFPPRPSRQLATMLPSTTSHTAMFRSPTSS